MNSDRLVFTQVMEHMPLKTFHRCVDRYQGNFSVKHFTCLDQFRVMAFAQLTYRESLRDIEACLRSQHNKLYRMGISGPVAKTTLAEANESRDWRIYADFAHHLIQVARKLYIKPINWQSSLSRLSMLWMQRQSTFASRCFRGPTSGRPRLLSDCIRSLISRETSRPSFTSLTAKCMRSTSWIFFPLNPAPSI